MHCMHIIKAILNYKKCNLTYRGAIFGWERLCIVDRRFYFDGETLFRYRVSGGRFHISQGETLFKERLCFGGDFIS